MHDGDLMTHRTLGVTLCVAPMVVDSCLHMYAFKLSAVWEGRSHDGETTIAGESRHVCAIVCASLLFVDGGILTRDRLVSPTRHLGFSTDDLRGQKPLSTGDRCVKRAAKGSRTRRGASQFLSPTGTNSKLQAPDRAERSTLGSNSTELANH